MLIDWDSFSLWGIKIVSGKYREAVKEFNRVIKIFEDYEWKKDWNKLIKKAGLQKVRDTGFHRDYIHGLVWR